MDQIHEPRLGGKNNPGVGNQKHYSEASCHPLSILFERCCVLAARVSDGDVPFIDAVDMAYSAADWAGLVGRFGDDQVQFVLADAFMVARP